jgi:zinc transporter 1/2/3
MCPAADGFGAKFNFACQKYNIPLTKSASALSSFLSSFYAAASNSLLPYGVDPAFLRSSSLYQPQLQGRVGWFYNTSDPREVPPATEMPRGFFHRSLQVWGSCCGLRYNIFATARLCG